MIEYKKQENITYQLKPEGIQIAREGSHEARFWTVLPPKGSSSPITEQDIVKQLGNDVMKLGRSQVLKLGWAKRDGPGYVRSVRCQLFDVGLRILPIYAGGFHR